MKKLPQANMAGRKMAIQAIPTVGIHVESYHLFSIATSRYVEGMNLAHHDVHDHPLLAMLGPIKHET